MTTPADSGSDVALRAILKSQYHAALAMLRETIDRCPDDLWAGGGHLNACWQVAYHALFFADFYMQPTSHGWVPWAKHQGNVQYGDGIPGPADPESKLPLVADPYSRADLLEYWAVCDARVDAAVDGMDLHSPESGFSWYPIPKLEHQIVNIRHIQHHAAQLADRLRKSADIGIDWAGARRAKR
ncbi:MAG: DinB family protein [Planctomycetes bacterium]|nr:DinB family protein [Planctomycetota bacterium]